MRTYRRERLVRSTPTATVGAALARDDWTAMTTTDGSTTLDTARRVRRARDSRGGEAQARHVRGSSSAGTDLHRPQPDVIAASVRQD